MCSISRTENSIKNMIVAMGTQTISIIIGIVSRAIFFRTLGEEYLGISGLFSSVITVLSLTNLGLGDSILYLLIKYFSKNDLNKVKGIFEFTKKMYAVLVLIIIGAGLLVMPMVFRTINLQTTIPNLKLYYWIFVLNTAFSYFCAPYNAIFQAEQKARVVIKSQFWATIIVSIVQMISLYLWKSYTVYLFVMLMTNIINFVYIRYMFSQHYAFLNNEIGCSLNEEDKREVVSATKNMFMIRLSGAMMSSIDNITISKFVGTAIVGIYSNYLVITEAARTFIKLLYQSIYSSVGDLNHRGDVASKKCLLEVELFIFHVLATIITIGIYVLIQDFIVIWLGGGYHLSSLTVILICVDFYINILTYAQINFVQTSELINKTKFFDVGMAVSNVILSVILGYKIGLEGILLATIISRLVFCYGARTVYVHKRLFEESAVKYYTLFLKHIISMTGTAVIVFFVVRNIDGTIWYMFILKGIIVVLLTSVLLWLIYRKNESYVYLRNKIIYFMSNKYMRK